MTWYNITQVTSYLYHIWSKCTLDADLDVEHSTDLDIVEVGDIATDVSLKLV